MNAIAQVAAPLDVLIVGAGISGIGMAAHLADANSSGRASGITFAMVDRRERIGGTWDLFRYPGIRSDSDMYTLGFAFEPWRDENSIASGQTILNYLDKVVDDRGLRQRIRFGQKVVSANWDSASGLWTVQLEGADGKAGAMTARFLYLGAGYYDHDNPHDAGIPGLASFGGTVIHPQFWPEGFDYSGKRVVVIGSGATAVTLVPSLTDKAAHVTMLQRTPTWYIQSPSKDPVANVLRRLLPEKWAYALIRTKNTTMQDFLFRRARTRPEGMGDFLKERVRESLGPAWSEKDFSPPYNPWEQRLCLVPDGDMFTAIREGSASVVTGRIKEVDKAGIVLEDGSRLDADVIVSATGLRLAVAGKIAVSVDGRPVNFAEHWYYRNCMFSGVPNFAALFGYLNAGWTLRVDIVADWLTRLLVQMKAWDADVATPVLPEDHDLTPDPVFDAFSSGYLQRARSIIPKIATTLPWRLSMDYRSDRKEMAEAPIDDGVMQFTRLHVAQAAPVP